jgi:hypothetical protein
MQFVMLLDNEHSGEMVPASDETWGQLAIREGHLTAVTSTVERGSRYMMSTAWTTHSGMILEP